MSMKLMMPLDENRKLQMLDHDRFVVKRREITHPKSLSFTVGMAALSSPLGTSRTLSSLISLQGPSSIQRRIKAKRFWS